MTFLSPGERAMLARLDEYELPVENQELFYNTQGDVVRLFMSELDARMVGIPEMSRKPKRGETVQEVARDHRLFD